MYLRDLSNIYETMAAASNCARSTFDPSVNRCKSFVTLQLQKITYVYLTED